MTNNVVGRRRPTGNKSQVPGHYVRQVFKEIGQFCACQQWETIVVVGIALVILTVFDLRPTPVLEEGCDNNRGVPTEIPVFSRWYVPKLSEYLILYGGQILAVLHIVYRIRNAFFTGSTVVLQVCSNLVDLQISQLNEVFFLLPFRWPCHTWSSLSSSSVS